MDGLPPINMISPDAPPGQQSILSTEELFTINDKVKSNLSLATDAKEDIVDTIKAKFGITGKETPTSVLHWYKNLSTLVDPSVLSVLDGVSPRIKSGESREIASRSTCTCLSQVAVSIETLFIPGRWREKPKDLTTGAALVYAVAKSMNECEMKPRSLHSLYNFDNIGGFLVDRDQHDLNKRGTWKTRKDSLYKETQGCSSIFHKALV